MNTCYGLSTKTQTTINYYYETQLMTLKKITFLKNVFCIMTFFFTISLSAQAEPEVLKDWTAMEEADFYFDVSFAVVKCSPNAKALILINTFNEDGTNPKVGFTLNFSDDKGTTAQTIVAPFASNLGICL